MTDKETEITTPAALAAWAGYHRPEMEISEKGAGLLLGYLDGHGYRLLEKDGMMMCRDIGTEEGRTIPVSLDEVVDMVFRWNSDMLEENRQKISFEEERLNPAVAFEIVGKFVDEFLGTGYEAVYAVHDNTAHTHGHILFNSVNCITGKKFRYEKGDWAKVMQPITNRLCEEYGLSTIDIEAEEKKKHSNYKDWNETQGKQSVRTEMIRRDLDACIMQAGTYEEFLDLLREMGYGIKQGKYLSVCPPGSERFCRCMAGGHQVRDVLRPFYGGLCLSAAGLF